MIKSMTGYGRCEADAAGRRLTVEVKAVNHRFLNFFAKLPPDLQRFEAEIQALVKGHLQRGQVSVFASWNGGASGPPSVTVNVEAARQAADALRRAAQAAGVPADIQLSHLLAIPAVVSAQTFVLDPEALWEAVSPVFEETLVELDALRVREGGDLAVDMRARAGAIEETLGTIEALGPGVLEDYRARLARKIEELVQDLPVETVAERVSLEVAVFADRSDISEEAVRLRSHLAKYRELLDGGGVVGRKLEFLLQEMNRETNTIGSKASSAEISRLVVEIKAELEKIREQVQNIE